MQNLTIYEVARLAGVSASTVSRVINNKPGVKSSTRKRVLDCLEESHYSPSETARGLVSQSSKLIGILVSDMRTTHHTAGVYYIERECARQGYCCMILNTGTAEIEKANAIQVLQQRRVEAAVLIGSTFQSEAVQRAIQEHLPNIPVVISNGYLDLPNVYGVITDEQGGVTECVKLLTSRGRENLALLVNRSTPSNRLKQLGFEFGIFQCLPGRTPLVVPIDNNLRSSYEATVQLMRTHPKIDGLIYSDDMLASAGLSALRDLRIPIPERVAVIGINNSAYAELSAPRLTSLDNQLYELSLATVRNVIDILHNRPAVKKVMIYSKIVERQTT